jgi:acetylornithine deacetylase/succinyl-diaminopimelate desuccinylase-like protein/amino acid transporter
MQRVRHWLLPSPSLKGWLSVATVDNDRRFTPPRHLDAGLDVARCRGRHACDQSGSRASCDGPSHADPIMIQTARPLTRILGLGFGLAMVFGGTVGVGILRLPGTLAAALGDSHLIVFFWILGGVYSLLGAVAVAELAAMLPEAGGFYVYARRAFGNGPGFVVGWSDWVNQTASLAYGALTAATFMGVLWPAMTANPRALSIAIIGAFTALHWAGLRIGSTLTRIISVSVGVMLLVIVVGCFMTTPVAVTATPPAATAAISLPLLSVGMLAAVVTALRAVFLTYDGWYSPIYLAEESTQPALTMPRALIGGTLVVAAMYVIINIAILRVLPMPVLAASDLPAADAARVVLPHGGAELVTVISLLTVLSLVNAIMLMTPRILLAIGRDGFFTKKAAIVSKGGTPRVALAVSSGAAAALIMSGTFEQIVAVAAVLFLLNYVSTYTALIVLRRREPATPRPYRAFGYPYTTVVVLVGCVALWIAAIVEDLRSGVFAAVLLILCAPVYAWVARRRRLALAAVAMLGTALMLAGTMSKAVAGPTAATPTGAASAAAAPRADQLAFRDLFRELVETNTSHSVGSCTLAAARMAARLRAAGYPESALHAFAVADHPKDGGLVAVLPGSDGAANRQSAKAILLLAHLDVVEARREDWSRDPFTLVEEGGYFYGRGTFDDKSMAAVWVDTLVRLRQSGFRPKRAIKMALTCGEEAGAAFVGAQYLATHERALIDAAFALNEFAYGVLDAQGHRVVMEIEAGEKTDQDYRLEVVNAGGHSSRPVKNNAIYHLAAGLTRLSEYEFPVQFNDTTRTYFSRMSGIVGGEMGAAMGALVKNGADAAAAAVVSADPRLNAMLRTTCVATLMDAGHASNALPQRARANINCRIFPGVGIEEVRQTLTRIVADSQIAVTTIEPSDPVVVPPPLTPTIMKPIEQVMRRVYPGIELVPVLQAAGTDAIYLAQVGIPTYGLSGMFVDPDLGNIHGLNERIRVQSLYDGRDFLYELVKVYAQQVR